MKDFPRELKGSRVVLKGLEPTFDNAKAVFAEVSMKREAHVSSRNSSRNGSKKGEESL